MPSADDSRPVPADGSNAVHESGTQSSSNSGQALATRGWRSPLAIFVSACLLIQSVTGLWLYFASFSLQTEVQLLVHVVVGLALLVPYLIYQVKHFLAWYRQKWTVVMLLGYLLTAMLLSCVVSGLFVTYDAMLGAKLSEFWDLVHAISGIGTAALVLVHVTMALWRRRAMFKNAPELATAVRRFALGTTGLVSLGAVTILVGAIGLRGIPAEFDVPENYSLSEYVNQFDEYEGNPFAPTYATTSSGKLVRPEVLSNSASCGTSGCHEEIYNEWLPSAHRFSAMNEPFQQVQKNFADDREPAETRYCAGCHDPISLFAGAKDIHNLSLAAPGMQEGCSCVACHSISKVDQRGNADYVLTPPQKYIWEDETGWKKTVSDFLIRAYPRQHLADYDRTILRTPEFCGACHKQFIPEALNHFGVSPGQNQYDEWRNSHWHTEDPETDLSCIDCHMRLVPDSDDPGRGEDGAIRRTTDDNSHRHHGTIATNMFIPKAMKLKNWKKHVGLTEQWIRGETVIDEIAHLWPAGPVVSTAILAPKQAEAGAEVSMRVIIANNKAGHQFTTGPLDFTRAWIHLTVTDSAGRTVAEWGALDPKTRAITDEAGKVHQAGNSPKEGTLVLEAEPMDQHGQPIIKHELWNKAGGRGARVVYPNRSDSQVYKFTVPKGTTGPLKVKANLNFRRYRQQFLDLVVPDMEKKSGVLQPTVVQSSGEAHITIRKPEVAAQ
ncbi:MAG: hypothetical protein CMJ48_11105 [Planctomycetaceae bacterium]|nr:hypothetical protein [Planctomycetaceae bacterium]